MLKYTLTGGTKELTFTYRETNITRTVTVYQIRKLSDNTLGGYIQSTANLDQSGDCWVGPDGHVIDRARVTGNAQVLGESLTNFSVVYGAAIIGGDAVVECGAMVGGQARVLENATVTGKAWVGGNARVYGEALIGGEARVGWTDPTSRSNQARVSGRAIIADRSVLAGDSRAYGQVKIMGETMLTGHSRAFGKASLSGRPRQSSPLVNIQSAAHLTENARISGCAVLKDQARLEKDAVLYGPIQLTEGVIQGQVLVTGCPDVDPVDCPAEPALELGSVGC